jgi:hypothetical protein
VLCEDGVLFEDFPSKQSLEYAVKLAENKQYLLWSQPWQAGTGGFVFVKKEGKEHLVNALNQLSL